MPRPLAIAMVYLGLFGFVAAASYVLLSMLGAQVAEFGRQVLRGSRLVSELLTPAPAPPTTAVADSPA